MKKGATTCNAYANSIFNIIALRNEKGSYNSVPNCLQGLPIIALRNEKGSYNIR